MSTISSRNQTNNQITFDRDLSKIFLWNNRYQQDQELNNSSYNPLSIAAGTLMARVVATGNVAPFNSAANDGSQFPIGVLASDVNALAAGAAVNVTICDFGDVAADKIIFLYSGDGLETAVSGRRVKDLIQAQGIKLVSVTEMTGFDN